MNKIILIILPFALLIITAVWFNIRISSERDGIEQTIQELPDPHEAHSVSYLTNNGIALFGSLRHTHSGTTDNPEEEDGHDDENDEDDDAISEIFLFSPDNILLDSLRDETNTGMGRSVIGFDDTLLISFPEANDRSGFIGVYRITDEKLKKVGEIKSSDDGNELDFGGSMDIAGTLLFVGADDRSVNGKEEVGGVYIIDLKSGREVSAFSPIVSEEHEFGAKVFAHADTKTLFVASEGVISSAIGGGSVDVFSYSDAGELTHLQHIARPDNFAGLFGHSLTHTDDYLLIGSISELENEDRRMSGTRGRVYVYRRNGDMYRYVSHTEGTEHSNFGFAMKYDNDTDEILISSPTMNTIGVYEITRDTLQLKYEIIHEATFFGHSFDISGGRLASTALGTEIGDEKFVFCRKNGAGKYTNCVVNGK